MTKSVGDLNLEFVEGGYEEENSEGNSDCVLVNDRPIEDRLVANPRRISQSSLRKSSFEIIEGDDNHTERQIVNGELHTFKEGVNDDNVVPFDPETDGKTAKEESGLTNSEDSDSYVDAFVTNKQSEDRRLPNAILPLLRHCRYESSESSCRYMTL